MQDRLLLKQFSTYGSQAAFAEIVKRYMQLVYSTCLREVGDRQMAEDVTQSVFLILAQKAPSLRGHTTLAGWLFWTARLASKDARRQERRRQRREHAAAQAEGEANWPTARPHSQELLLNEALAALKPGEREAVLLRFFDEVSFAEVGTTLGLSEDTAQKRVSRALEKMQTYFRRHQEVLSATALMGILAAEAARSVPPGCAKPLLQIVPGLKTSLLDSSLFGSQAYHISQGVLRMMKVKTALTTLGVGALAVASVSLLMAGGVRGAGGIVGTWSGKYPATVRTLSSRTVKVQPQEMVDVALRFNGDGTYTLKELHGIFFPTIVGKYKLTGSVLTMTPADVTIHDNASTLPLRTQAPEEFTMATPFNPEVATISKDGKTLTIADASHRIVLKRQ